MIRERQGFAGYTLVSPPAALTDREPREWSAREARKYFDWFALVAPVRLQQLGKLIGQEDTHPLDYSPGSLAVVGRWLARRLVTRPLSDEEIEGELSGLSERARRAGVEDWTLTSESFSLAVDAGIYLGETLRRGHPESQWTLCTRPKTDISFHQPVLRMKGTSIPVLHLAVTFAFGLARGRKSGDDLERVYWIWSEKALREAPRAS